MIRLVSEVSPVEAAWAAYDAAMIRLHVMYEQAAAEIDTQAGIADRREQFAEVARLRAEFEALFLGANPEPGDAA